MVYQAQVPHGSELRVELEEWNAKRYYAKYNIFQVGNELSGYRLHVAGYTGTAGNALAYHSDRKFTTYDRDNDSWGGNCAASYPGGFWHGACIDVNLNGVYYRRPQSNGDGGHGVCWHGNIGDSKSLKFAEMKMRRKV